MILPIAAYAMLATSVVLAGSYLNVTFFLVAGTTLVLLFVGIHNAWDAVTYHVFSVRKKRTDQKN
jgi:hypothetical protein